MSVQASLCLTNNCCVFFFSCKGLFVSFRMLDDFGHEIENTESRMDNVMKKMAKVLHMSNGNLSCLYKIGVLLVVHWQTE